MSLSAEPRPGWTRYEGNRQTWWNISRPRIPSSIVLYLPTKNRLPLIPVLYLLRISRPFACSFSISPITRFIPLSVFPFRLCTQYVTNRKAPGPSKTAQASRSIHFPLGVPYCLDEQALTVKFAELAMLRNLTALSHQPATSKMAVARLHT